MAVGGTDAWLALVVCGNLKGEVKGSVDDRSWPCPVSSAMGACFSDAESAKLYA